MVGNRYGKWTVKAIHNTGPWPWAWLRSDDGIHARVSVHSLNRFCAGKAAS